MHFTPDGQRRRNAAAGRARGTRREQAGAGGWGDPFERDPVAVLRDVRNGFVSPEAARRDYGVAIDTAAWSVDEAETARLRGR